MMARVNDLEVLLVIDAARALLEQLEFPTGVGRFASERRTESERTALRTALAALDKADEEEFAAYMNSARRT